MSNKKNFEFTKVESGRMRLVSQHEYQRTQTGADKHAGVHTCKTCNPTKGNVGIVSSNCRCTGSLDYTC